MQEGLERMADTTPVVSKGKDVTAEHDLKLLREILSGFNAQHIALRCLADTAGRASPAHCGDAFFDQIALNLPEPQRRQKEPLNLLSLGRFIIIHYFRSRRLRTVAQFFGQRLNFNVRHLVPFAFVCFHQRFSPR